MQSRIILHTVYNSAGLIVPIVVAIATMPILLNSLGTDRFGILTLIWAIVSYFGIFDLGLGRALTMQMSVLMIKDDYLNVYSIIRTTLAILLFLGFLAGCALFGVTSILVEQMKGELSTLEVSGAVNAMSFALPFIIVTSGVRGVLEAKNAFGLLNLVRLPLGMINFIGPVAIALYGSGRLDDISWLLAYARVVSFVIHFWCMCRVMPGIFNGAYLESKWLGVLIINGGWMTVSNIVSPLMGYLDRFIVGLLLSASFVAYYATPQELILKIYIIPGALTAVLFPRFASDFFNKASKILYWKSVFIVSILIFSLCAFAGIFSLQILGLWIGADFAINSYKVMQIFLVGIFFGAISSIPYTYLQATGYAKIAAVSHVVQVPFFLVLSYILISKWGIEGAAIAWSARLIIDAFILFFGVQIVAKKNSD